MWKHVWCCVCVSLCVYVCVCVHACDTCMVIIENAYFTLTQTQRNKTHLSRFSLKCQIKAMTKWRRMRLNVCSVQNEAHFQKTLTAKMIFFVFVSFVYCPQTAWTANRTGESLNLLRWKHSAVWRCSWFGNHSFCSLQRSLVWVFKQLKASLDLSPDALTAKSSSIHLVFTLLFTFTALSWL